MSGHFTFQIGVDRDALTPLIDRVNDAKERFVKTPVVADYLNQLENRVMVSSIHGTDTIEGGTLSTREVGETLELPPGQAKEEDQRRITNLKAAYELGEGYAIKRYQSQNHHDSPGTLLFEDMFLGLHRTITSGLSHGRNVPGKYRDDQKGHITLVGNEAHGGVYIPPKHLVDIELLMGKFIEWINSEDVIKLEPLIRAPLAHYYFERIHPFADGNGRVGRIVEAIILKTAGYKYASSSMSGYYLKNTNEYFTLFNMARKKEKKKEPYPNTDFVKFFLQGMLAVINENHDFVNHLFSVFLFESRIKSMYDKKEINHRQYTIVSNLLVRNEEIFRIENLMATPWYSAMYKKLTVATRYRDFRKLEKLDLLHFEKGRKIIKLKMP